jgi:hypothetical protein
MKHTPTAEHYSNLPRSYRRTFSELTLLEDAQKMIAKLGKLDPLFMPSFTVDAEGTLVSACGKYQFNPAFFGLRQEQIAPGQNVEINL